jgi:hypothetical protein
LLWEQTMCLLRPMMTTAARARRLVITSMVFYFLKYLVLFASLFWHVLISADPSVCQTFVLDEGCYGSGSCGGTISVEGASSGVTDSGTMVSNTPIIYPTYAPVDQPTSRPTLGEL